MSNYMSQYEQYYKNINKRNSDKQVNGYTSDKKKYTKSIFSTIKNNGYELSYFSKDYWIRRLIRDTSASLILLLLFIGLKYIKNDYVQQAYRWTKYNITSSFNYNQTIDAFNNSEIGTIKVNQLNIGGITVEDLKSEKISSKVNNLINYLKNKMIIER